MIYDTFKKRRFVRVYDNTVSIPETLINSLLQKTWEVTPSKNNFMPYTIHVIGPGPDNQKYKNATYINCLGNEATGDGIDFDKIIEERYSHDLPNYSNILSCSYLIIFTMRLETQPSPFIQWAVSRGHKYEALDQSKLGILIPTAAFEMGLFADTFSGMCLENDLDVSIIGCFSKEIKKWKEHLPFITQEPVMTMTVGKAHEYLVQPRPHDLRPNYERIVNFVK